MKKLLIFLCVLLLGSCTDTASPVTLNPDDAVLNAEEEFLKNGYSPMTIVSNGESYNGENVIDQDIIFCARDGMDINLYIVTVDSTNDPASKNYVTLYNTEMMRLLATERGCLQ